MPGPARRLRRAHVPRYWPGGMRLMRTDSSPSLISISAMPDSSSSSISFLTLRMSMAGVPRSFSSLVSSGAARQACAAARSASS